MKFTAEMARVTLQRMRYVLSLTVRNLIRRWQLWAYIIFMLVEVAIHVQSLAIRLPPKPLDPPFHVGCYDPPLNTTTRANATLVMLARNSVYTAFVVSSPNSTGCSITPGYSSMMHRGQTRFESKSKKPAGVTRRHRSRLYRRRCGDIRNGSIKIKR